MNYQGLKNAKLGYYKGEALIVLFLAVAFWVIDMAADTYLSGTGSFVDRLLSPGPRELATLIAFLIFLGAAGIIIRSRLKERAKFMERLIESEELNRAVLNSAVDGIVTIGEDARIVRFNPAAEKIFGYTSEEVIGRNVNMLMPEPYHSEHNGYVNNYLATGRPKVIGIGREVEGRRKDGTTFPLELAINVMRVGDRRMFTGILRDITYRKKLEQQKADFYAMITHDIKSPMTVIMGFAELVRETAGEKLDSGSVEMLEGIEKNSRKVADLVEDFLAASRMESDNFKLSLADEDVSEILSQVMEEYAPVAEKKSLKLTMELMDGLPLVKLDKKYIRRALSNLMDNAMNYTPKGGSVSVGARAAPDGQLVISVSDSGMGIPKSDINKVFDKYYRSPKTAGLKGSGLGLAIVKGVTEAHGGRVELESVVDKGTTFRLILPPGQAKAEASAGGIKTAA